MSKNGVKQVSAFPQGMPEHGAQEGLTKKEYFAALAMQGILSGVGDPKTYIYVAEASVKIANELIKELEK